MNLFKTYIYVLLGIAMSLAKSYGQTITKSQQFEFMVDDDIAIELNSKYTNIEFELTDNRQVSINAIMEVEGLSQSEVDTYFKKWNIKTVKENNKVLISSFLVDKSVSNLKKNGYYKGYFLDKTQQDAIALEMDALSKNLSNPNKKNESKYDTQSAKENTRKFDFEAYIEDGDAYLLKWQKENNEPIGKRWFNKTRKERIQMKNNVKGNQPKKSEKQKVEKKTFISPKTQLKVKLKKSELPIKHVRSLSKRAIINKTLKISIPRRSNLNINVRHGRVIISDEIINLNAELSYVLLKANKISGSETAIKGSYTNFEVKHWKEGSLEVAFSDYVLLKKVGNIKLISNASTVSIDNIIESINAIGNYKMLDITASSNIKLVNIDIEDSKKVWIKLPDNTYNLQYEGVNTKLIHPEKFKLKTAHNNTKKQITEKIPLKKNDRLIKIKALSCVMQIYDKPWEDLKIKSLEGL